MQETRSWLRLLPVVVMLVCAALFLHARSRPEESPPRKSLSDFPLRVGDWNGVKEFPIDAEVRKLLTGGDLLERVYERAPGTGDVELFLAYFPSQRTGDLIHSPKHCLPGAGWLSVQSAQVNLPGPNGTVVHADRYLIARGADRQTVLYWYQAHGRTQASEYKAKFYLIADAMRFNRTDGSLVRIITPLGDGEPVERGEQRDLDFARALIPLLPAYIPN